MDKNTLCIDDLEQLNRDLVDHITGFSECKLNKVELTTDILEEGVKDSLLEIYLHLAENDDQIFIVLMDEFEKRISKFKGYLDTESVKNRITTEPEDNGHFSCVLHLKAFWPDIEPVWQVSNSEELTQFNAKTFYRLSNQGHNAPDMDIIKQVSGELGRTMSCTVQGKNKEGLFYDFDLPNRHKGPINYEYHLKINFDNNGNKVNRLNFNRAYFGLRLINGKKYITLAHLGCHYDE
jgi:hypothetical protein